MINITKTIMGAGILCLPHAIQEGGMGIGLAALLATCVASLGGFLAVGYACHATGAATYRDAWRRTVGGSPALVDVVVATECAVTCVGYVILVLDYVGTGLHGVLGLDIGAAHRKLIALCSMGVFIPLCLKTDLHSLRFSSMLGCVAMLYTLLFVITEALGQDHSSAAADIDFRGADRNGAFRAVSVMTSAYIAHFNAPAAYAELAGHPDPWRGFCAASVLSFAVVVSSYVAFAMAGFLRFSPGVRGNVLLNYDSGPFVLVSWATMALTLLVSFPLLYKPARDTVAAACGIPPPAAGQHPSAKGAGGARCAVAGVPCAWAMLSVAGVALITVCGVLATDISRVLAIRGALLGCPVSFVLPGLMLLHCPRNGSSGRAAWRLSAYALLAFGLLAGGFGVRAVL